MEPLKIDTTIVVTYDPDHFAIQRISERIKEKIKSMSGTIRVRTPFCPVCGNELIERTNQTTRIYECPSRVCNYKYREDL